MSFIKSSRPLLGTFVEISLSDPSLPERELEAMAELAFGRIARVQSLMSFHDPSSELSRLNACGHLHPLPVNEWTREVIGEAVRLSRVSEGIFDIASPPAPEEELKGNFRDIVLHRDGRVSFRRQLSLDLSIISRGYAVDKAADLLASQNVQRATINAGGDIRFIGTRPSNLSIGTPVASQQVQLHAQVTGPAVSTTAACIANRRHHWKRVSDILHPRTLKPMKSNVSVSVFANTCVQADALAWVVLFDEPQSWQSLLAKEKASAVFVTSKGEMVRFPAAA